MTQVSTDPIADMLARIRNAIAVQKREIRLPHSNVKESVVKILKDTHFISGYDIEPAAIGKTLVVSINEPYSSPRITHIKRLSKPGRRVYTGADKIPVVKRGRGIVILSTSRGVMTGDQAKQAGVGGELICQIY
jgi:small subunit ribosomal protein S8